MKAIIVLKDLINGKRESFAKDMTVGEAEEFILEAIGEIEELQRENTALKITLDRLNLQYVSNEALKQSMLNYDECYDKLVKAQSYIVDLENQIKEKSNGWMNK